VHGVPDHLSSFLTVMSITRRDRTMSIGRLASAKPLVWARTRTALYHFQKSAFPTNGHPASAPCANNANSVIDQSTL
jgi:hypothetical protein